LLFNIFTLDIHLLVQTLYQTVAAQAKMIAGLQALNEAQATLIVTLNKQVAASQAEVAILKNKRIAATAIRHHPKMKTG
jgi:hypothetical protein